MPRSTARMEKLRAMIREARADLASGLRVDLRYQKMHRQNEREIARDLAKRRKRLATLLERLSAAEGRGK